MKNQGRLERIANSAEDEATLSGYVEEINAVLTDYQVCLLSVSVFQLIAYLLQGFSTRENHRHYS